MFNEILASLMVVDGNVLGAYNDIGLRSAFQPIISFPHQRIVGYEALVRGYSSVTERMIPPPEIFESAQTRRETVYLDRLCRALHVHNFKAVPDELSWLFLNVNPEVMVNGREFGPFLSELLDSNQIPAHRVVVEIMESPLDEAQLDKAVDFYRDLGCLIAIDDFGAGHSNFQRIWRIKPQIVKLDQSIIRQAVDNAVARRMLPSIVSTLHEAGSLVLIEGVETREEAMIAMRANIDLVQGYYFGRPAQQWQPGGDVKHLVEDLFSEYAEEMAHSRGKKQYQEHFDALQRVRLELLAGIDHPLLATNTAYLLTLPGADRCYLLGEDGVQIGDSVIAEHGRRHGGNQFAPLEVSNRARWLRRPYLQRALHKPGEVHLTRPYLSVATGRLCVTLSIAYRYRQSTRVLCYDVDHEILDQFYADERHRQPKAAATA